MLIAADNIRITDRAIEKALFDFDAGHIQKIAIKCEQAGAAIIDINPGPLTHGGEEKMVFLVEAIQKVSALTLSLDTTNPVAISAGARACRGKVIINGFSLQTEKIEKILPLAIEFGCDIIGFLIHPDGRIPRDAAERMELAVQLFKLSTDKGLDPGRLIIDPVIVPLTYEEGSNQAMEVLNVIKILPELLGIGVRTVAGLSNLTAGRGLKRKKSLLQHTYLSMLAAAGLDMALMDMFQENIMDFARACNVLTGSGIFSWDSLP